MSVQITIPIKKEWRNIKNMLILQKLKTWTKSSKWINAFMNIANQNIQRAAPILCISLWISTWFSVKYILQTILRFWMCRDKKVMRECLDAFEVIFGPVAELKPFENTKLCFNFFQVEGTHLLSARPYIGPTCTRV